MDRRRFLLTSLVSTLATPRVSEAQQAGKAHHIGFLPSGASEAHRSQLEALRAGLRELGYPGQDYCHYSGLACDAE